MYVLAFVLCVGVACNYVVAMRVVGIVALHLKEMRLLHKEEFLLRKGISQKGAEDK